jgi:transposase
VEGTGSYGAALTRLLRAEGVPVIEVNRPDRSARRRRGKSDVVDAEAAARAVLAQREYVRRRTAEGLSKREIIRCLKRYLARTVYRIITAAAAPNARQLSTA